MVFSPTYYREEVLCDDCEILSLFSDDNKELEGVCYSPSGAKKTILYFGGRSQDSVGLINRLANLYPKTQIITFNYRSYGKSEGKINEKHIFNDALKIAQVVQKNYGDFYLLGFSLGSSVAAYVASKHKCEALILVAAFDSIVSLAKLKYASEKKLRELLLPFVLRYKFTTGESVKNVDAKTYLFVSKNDETTYIQNARELKNKIKNLHYYEEFENLTHKEIFWDTRVSEKIREQVE